MRSKETYILSLWFEEGEQTSLRGLLQSVKTGEKQPFSNVEQLLALLKAVLKQAESIPDEKEVVEERGE